MLLLFIFVPLLILTILLFAIGSNQTDSYDEEGWYIGAAFCGFVAIFVLVLSLIITGVAWSNQVSDQASINQFKNNELVYQKRAVQLTAKFKIYLAEQYPTFEKSIFKEIGPQNVAVYLAEYPQLKTSNTLLALVGQIRQLNDAVYQQQININQANKNIYTRQHNPWYLSFLIP